MAETTTSERNVLPVKEHGNESVGEYSTYFARSDLSQLEDTYDELLTRMDELQTLFTLTRDERSDLIEVVLPRIVSHEPQLRQFFADIDRAEMAVAQIERNVTAMEAAVDAAAGYMGYSPSPIGRLVKSVLPKWLMSKPKSKSMGDHPNSGDTQPIIPDVFSTDQLFQASES